MVRLTWHAAVAVSLWVSATLAADVVDRFAVRPVRSAQVRTVPLPQLVSQRAPGVAGGPFAPTAAPSLNGSPVEYLVITSTAMRPAFERLTEWKTAKGVPAVVRTLDDIAATGVVGSDLAETIRLYLRDAYLLWGVKWVLLGGDTEVIPARYATAEFLGFTQPISDLYYSCLDGDWNADGDAYYGEAFASLSDPGDDADLVAELYLGRGPVSTLAEANLFVDKTLAYDRPALLDFQDSMLLMAEVLFPASYTPGVPISIDGASFAENLRALVPGTVRLSRLYETHAFYPGTSPLTTAAATAAMNSGHATVVHIGHGYRYTLSTGDGSLDVGDAASFTNGARAGLFYMLNCTAAAFDFESFAEALLLNPTGGATVVLGAAREAFPLAASDYQTSFFRHAYALGERRIGEAMARSRVEFVDSAILMTVDRWTQLTYTLLGDPEALVWAAPPRTLQVLGLPASLQVGGHSLGFQVQDAQGPVANALVCARKLGEDYRVTRTDASGFATLQLQLATAGDVELNITAPDHVSLAVTRPAVTPTRALVVSDAGLADDGGGTGAGNSDGRLDAGETARLTLPLRNAGTATVSGLSATLSSSDPSVQVLQGASNYLNLAAGQDGTAVTPFVVRILPNTLDGRVVSLQLQLQHAQGAETRRIELLVHAARIELVELRLDDTRAGDGDGIQDPNEEIDLAYTLENIGTGSAQNVQLELSALDPGLVVVGSTTTVVSLVPGARTTLPALVVRESDLSQPHRGRLRLTHLQEPAGRDRRIDLRPPPTPLSPRFLATDRVDQVHVEWDVVPASDLYGYAVERALAAGGLFAPASADPVQNAYFRDAGLAASTRYAYRIIAVDSTLLQSSPGAAATVSTNPPNAAGWPLTVGDRSASSIAIADVNGDGGADLIGAARQLYAWNGAGIELLDADSNAFTWGLFHGTNEVFGSVALADLDAVPGKEIIAPTWDPVNRLVVILRRDGSPLPGWPQALVPAPESYRGSQVAPVVVDLEGDGRLEILVAARDGRLYAWHASGAEVADGDANPSTHGVLLDTGSPFLRSAPGVADLDPTRAGTEIIIGGTNGTLYALDARGVALSGWPRTTFGAGTAFNGQFASGITVADLDRDGIREMIVLDGSNRLHALHLDGNELAGFPVEGIRGATASLAPSPAIGNLAGDANLEIVIAGTDGRIHVVNAQGVSLLPGGFIASGATTESSPILGDCDGDPEIEIVLGNEEGDVGAWNLDGSPVPGFPIALRAEVRGTPTFADVNGDGQTDLALLAWDGRVNVWELGVPWNAARYPWPTYRGDVHRTGSYGYEVPTPVEIQDASVTWHPSEGRVVLAWRAIADAGSEARFQIHRAGPFDRDPLGSADLGPYTESVIGEVRGTGDLEFVDPRVEPGSWYVYSLGILQQEPDGDATERRAGSWSIAIAAPTSLRLLANVPNPCHRGTRVRFEVPARAGGSEVRVTVHDVRGRRVRMLADQRLRGGVHTVDWDGRDDLGQTVAHGMYVVRVASAGQFVTAKLTVVR